MSVSSADSTIILENCEKLITQGKTKEALRQLTALKRKSIRKGLASLSSQFNTLEKEFNGGIITHDEFLSKTTRINNALLTIIQQVEEELAEQPEEKAVVLPLWANFFLAVILGGLVVWGGNEVFNHQPTKSVDQPLDCPNGHKKAVRIAAFQQDLSGGFSESLFLELQANLSLYIYNLFREEPEEISNSSYHDTIAVKFFEQSCDTSGLFVNGRWDKDRREFNCWIDLFNLYVEIPGLESYQNIFLNNPPGIEFSIREDSKFLANFIIGILKTYEGETLVALSLLTGLEKDSVLMQDNRLSGNIYYFKGLNYAARGDMNQAEEFFNKAVAAIPDLVSIVQSNLETARRIFEIMNNDPELTLVLNKYLREDSLLENLESEKLKPVPLDNKENEAKVTEKVVDNLKEEFEREAIDSSVLKAEENKQREDQVTNGNIPESFDLLNNEVVDRIVQEDQFEERNISQLDESTINERPKILSIDGVKAIEINGEIWMAENLNLPIEGSWCFDSISINCDKYGRLYTWEAATKACKLLGSRWRLPTDTEWQELAKFWGGFYDKESSRTIGNPKQAYDALVAEGKSNFGALLGGYRSSIGYYEDIEKYGDYWSGTGRSEDYAWYYGFNKDDKMLNRYTFAKSYAYSCRCIRD